MVYTINDIVIINDGNVGIGTFPQLALDLRGSKGFGIPRGSTEQRIDEEGLFRYNTTEDLYEIFAQGQWVVVRPSFSINSVSTQVLKHEDNTLTVFGQGLRNDDQWKFIGISKKQYSPKQIEYVSEVSVNLTRPDVFPVSDGPYQIQCRQLGRVIYFSSISAGALPIFSQTGIVIVTSITPTTVSFNVTDDIGGSIVSVAQSAGTFPPGLVYSVTTSEINALFSLSGTVPWTNRITNYPFTLTAIDAGGNTVSQNFSITVRPKPPVFLFTRSLGTISGTNTTSMNITVSGNTYNAVMSHLSGLSYDGAPFNTFGYWRAGWQNLVTLIDVNGGNHTGIWFGMNFPTNVAFSIWGYTIGGSNYDTPASWVVLSSATGSDGTWIIVDEQTKPVSPVDDSVSMFRTYYFNAGEQNVHYYRLLVKSRTGFNQGTLLIGQISFHGDFE